LKRKAKIFKAFELNVKHWKEIEKRANLLRHIFKAKYTVNKLKYQVCLRKNRKYSNTMAKEFKRNLLMKKIFGLLYSNYYEVKNRRNRKLE
jgi:hypothetical protein